MYMHVQAAHEAAARTAIQKHNMVTKPPWNDMQKHLFAGDTGITVCSYPNGKLGDGMRCVCACVRRVVTVICCHVRVHVRSMVCVVVVVNVTVVVVFVGGHCVIGMRLSMICSEW